MIYNYLPLCGYSSESEKLSNQKWADDVNSFVTMEQGVCMPFQYIVSNENNIIQSVTLRPCGKDSISITADIKNAGLKLLRFEDYCIVFFAGGELNAFQDISTPCQKWDLVIELDNETIWTDEFTIQAPETLNDTHVKLKYSHPYNLIPSGGVGHIHYQQSLTAPPYEQTVFIQTKGITRPEIVDNSDEVVRDNVTFIRTRTKSKVLRFEAITNSKEAEALNYIDVHSNFHVYTKPNFLTESKINKSIITPNFEDGINSTIDFDLEVANTALPMANIETEFVELPPYWDYVEAYYYKTEGTEILDYKNGNNATIQTSTIFIFPNIAGDIFNRVNSSYYIGLPVYSDVREWYASDFNMAHLLDFQVNNTENRLFFKDSSPFLKFPVIVYNRQMTVEERIVISEFLNDRNMSVSNEDGSLFVADEDDIQYLTNK